MNIAEVTIKLKNLAYKIRKEVRCLCAHYPQFYFSQREKLYGFVDDKTMIHSDTEIVIDGYPCSANTFAEKAFKMAQQRAVSIAHHTHDPSQLIAAAKANVPTIVLVRNPEEAVLSYVTRFCEVSNKPEPEVAQLIYDRLREYMDFYRRIIKYRESYVIAEFNKVTSAYDLIIKQVNNKYGVDFTPFDCSDKNVKQVFLTIEKSNQQRMGYLDRKTVALPSFKREKKKMALRSYLNIQRIDSILQASRQLYYEIKS